MPFITSDQIRDISIKTVENFLNNKIPLSVGLAKQASYYELNSDQLQRAIESTNSIAYLKVLSLSEDRTVEFPLCKYAEVMQEIALPKDILIKAASVASKIPESFELVKVASVKECEPPTLELSLVEKQVYFIKMAAQNKRELEELRGKEMFLGPELIKAAKVFKEDALGLEKLATVSTGYEFAKITSLVYGSPQVYADTGIFKTAELNEAKSLLGLLKQAEELISNIKVKQELADKGDLVKQAMFGAIGSVIGRVAGAVASAPFKAVGSAIGRSAMNAGESMASTGMNAANKVRSAVGAEVKPVPVFNKRKFGIGAGLATAGGVALDASMYSPGRDKTTGRSKDVWTSLQKE